MRVRTLTFATLAGLAGVALYTSATTSLLSAQPDSTAPPASATRTATTLDLARGKAVYDSKCVECHGAAGKGDGPAAHLLAPRPRDFSTGRYKIRTTESGSLPTDDDLRRSVRLGLGGSAMPAWQGVISDDEIVAVVDYIKSLSPRFQSESPQPVDIAERLAARPADPRAPHPGAAVYEKLQCSKCHGTDGRGTGAVATEFEDDWHQPLRATDLTEPWTFRGGATIRDVFLRFRTGLAGTPMPSFKDAGSDADMWDLAGYVVSMARKPLWEMSPDEVAQHFAREDEEARANPVRRGHNLVDTIGCATCHTPVDAEKRELPGLRLAGGTVLRLDPYGVYPAGNLTSDKETGLGSWTDDEIKRALTRGILRDGTRLLPYPMDWASFATMSPADIDAIVAYLRTVPPVYNKVPRPSRTVVPLYLWGKFRMLVLGGDPPITFFPGNAGTTRGGAR